MVELNDNLGFTGVQRIEVSDIALGGNEINAPNLQLKQLASRDKYLRDLIAPDTAAQNSITQLQAVGIAAIAQGRLTLATGNPQPSSDLTAQGTIFYTPYIGDYVSIWNASVSRWEARQFTERSLSLSGLLANTNYDIFIFDNAGTLTLQAVAWSSSGAGTSTRALAISRRNGVWVKTSDNRRYLGTIRTVAAGQCEDSAQNRYVWNAENRISRSWQRIPGAATYTYGTLAYRALNNDTSNQVRCVIGIAGTSVRLDAGLACNSSDSNPVPGGRTGIGWNRTNAQDAQIVTDRANTADQFTVYALGLFSPGIGYHYFQQLEEGMTNGASLFQVLLGAQGNGIIGVIET